MDLVTWPVVAGVLAVAVLVLMLAVFAVICLVPRAGPEGRAKRENARAMRQKASDERDKLRAERGKAQGEREERARKARN